MTTLDAIQPATGEVIDRHPVTSPDARDALIDAAAETQRRWAATSLATRADWLRRVADRLDDRRAPLADLMAREMGKPRAQGRAEVDKCAWVCRYYAEHGADFLADDRADTDARRSYVTYRPLGLLLAIMPWNFPIWQVLRCAAPALMAGNGVILKHAPNVPGCALAIEELLRIDGHPQHLLRTVLLAGNDEAEALIDDRRIRAVTLTGSTRAGRAVAARAGRQLKPIVLELGGSDPYLILADADVEQAAALCVQSRLHNSGQTCIAAKRFIVVDAVRAAFERAVIDAMRARTMGDPFDDAVDVGPMARVDLRDALHAQVTRSLDAGARLMLGGVCPDGPGAFYPPSVLTDVAPGMPAFDEELFGPVAAIVPVADEDEAIARANETVYGLGAAVFTRDVARGERIAADRLEAGCCFVNDFVRSDPRLPFGGIKDSGHGRELGREGIRAFCNVKTVCVA
ncbi:MAG: NAD-dependent succinate-semialdehyde dehydrogenase [Acidobacteriota bacterium]